MSSAVVRFFPRRVYLAVFFCLLHATLGAALLRMPEVTALSRATPATVAAPGTVTLNLTITPGSNPIKTLAFTLRTPSGATRVLEFPAPGAATAFDLGIGTDWQSGAYQLDRIVVTDTWDRSLSYTSAGAVTASTLATGVPLSAIATLPTSHPLDFSAVQFTVTGGVATPTAPRITALTRASAATLSPGGTARYDYAFTPGSSPVARVILLLRHGPTNLPGFKFFTLENPPATGVIEYPILAAMYSGTMDILSFQLVDSHGRTTTYSRPASVSDVGYAAATRNTTHALDLAALAFTLTGGRGTTPEATGATVSLNTSGPVAPGGSVSVTWSLVTGGMPARATEIQINAPFNSTFRVAVSGTSGTTVVPVDSGWINGSYRVAGIAVIDADERVSLAAAVTPPTFNVAGAQGVPPFISTQPREGETIILGRSSSANVTALGAGTLTYQWYEGARGDTAKPVSGATNPSVDLRPQDSATFWVRVSDGTLFTDSNLVTLVVIKPPVITVQPVNQSVPVGGTARFSVTATGLGTLTYEWRSLNRGYAQGNGPTLEIPNVTAEMAGQIWCNVSNQAGQVQTQRPILNVRVSEAPLTVTHQPEDVVTVAGISVPDFQPVVTGNPPLLYQWQKDGVDIFGATSLRLSIGQATTEKLGAYRLRITNGAETVETRTATLSFTDSPLIQQQPLTARSATVGAEVWFDVSATGRAPLTYQWRKNGQPIAGATSTTLLFRSVALTDAGTYDVVVTNPVGTATSRAAVLTVNAPVIAPQITRSPVSQTLASGAALTLSVEATGSDLTYQWRKDGRNIPGATSATLSLSGIAASQAGRYMVEVVNTAGSRRSSDAFITVTSANTAPVFVRQPQSQSFASGELLYLTAVVDGAQPLQYRWHFNGVPLTSFDYSGIETETLSANFSAARAGSYTLVVTNSAGTTTSQPAIVTAASTNPARLVNLSVRANVSPAVGPLMVGFVVGGPITATRSLTMLVRGVGRALEPYGVTDALEDPVLTIYGGNTVIATNDNWDGFPEVSSTAARVGAFPFPLATSRDAAIVTEFFKRDYSAHISGARDGSGTALAEIYDANSGSLFRLVNLSARTRVRPDAPLIAGFVIGGEGSRTVLIRAVGPGLAVFGATDLLADPEVELYDGQSKSLATNADWGGNAEVAQAAARVGAFRLDDASKDAALLVTLPPGAYTAKATGKNATSGSVLIEVYEIQ